MNTLEIFGLQFVLSLIVWSLIARWLIAPWLQKMPSHDALFWLTLPHAFRHIGMVFLVPGVVAQSMPDYFSLVAAYGDLAAGILALLSLIALRSGWAGTLILVWLFNIVGTLDLFNALRHSEIPVHMQASWYIPTFFVPLLLVTHFMSFSRLFKSAASMKSVNNRLQTR